MYEPNLNIIDADDARRRVWCERLAEELETAFAKADKADRDAVLNLDEICPNWADPGELARDLLTGETTLKDIEDRVDEIEEIVVGLARAIDQIRRAYCRPPRPETGDYPRLADALAEVPSRA